MPAAAQEEMFSPPMVRRGEEIFFLAAAVAAEVETPIVASKANNEKPHQGVARQNRAPQLGQSVCNCTIALGVSWCWWSETALGAGDSYDYDAFGNLTNSTGSTPNVYLFAGEQYDPALNLYYNRARYLNTTTGRFWSMDTAEGNNRDPLSLHKYLYAEGNPVDHVDPSGHEIDEVLFAVAVAVVVLTLSTPANTPIVINQLTYNTVLQEPNIWEINWKLTRASTRGGWIVQHIVADFTGVGHYEYWEAWPIPANSNVPSLHGVDEYGVSYSDRFGGPAGSQIDGNASFYEGLTLPSSFTIQPQGFPAGILRATTSDPNLPTGNATFPVERFWVAH